MRGLRDRGIALLMGKRKKGRMLLAAFSALLLTLGAAGMADTQYVEGKTQAKQIDVMFTHDTHRLPIHIADDKLRQRIPAGRSGLKHIGKSLGAIIKFMVAKRRDLAADFSKHPKLRRLTFINRLHQCSHGKIPAV